MRAELPLPTIGAPPAPRVPRPARFTLPNGLRVAAHRMGGTPHVALRLICPAGSRFDDPDALGIAALTGAVLTEGTQHLSADEVNARLDLLGASLNVSVGHDFAEIDAFFLSETFADALTLCGEVVREPAFSAHETERARAESLDALIARSDDAANVADDRFAHEVFGAGHPYATPAFGTESGISAATAALLRDFHERRYRPDGSFLAIAGDFDEVTLEPLLATAFGDWTGAPTGAGQSPSPDTSRKGQRRVLLPWDDAFQAEIRIGGLGLDRRSPEWVRGAVANYIVGGSTITSRLGANLREAKGWTYGVRAGFAAGVLRGGWGVETAVDADVAEAAVREIEAELANLVEQPVGDEELQRARNALILSLPRAFETPSRVVSRLATIDAYALPADYWMRFADAVSAVSAEDVRAVAARCFDPSAHAIVVVGAPE